MLQQLHILWFALVTGVALLGVALSAISFCKYHYRLALLFFVSTILGLYAVGNIAISFVDYYVK